MNKFNVQPIENPTNYTVQVNGEHKIFVPDDLRRACFWAAHFPLHHGLVYTAQVLRGKNLYWPLLENSILQFLSQCVCAKKKPNKFKRFASNSKHLSATYPLELVCIDLYFYNGRLYFTLIDVFSGFPFCIQVYSKESTQVKLAFDKFCAAYAAPHNILLDNGGEFSLILKRPVT